MNFASYTLELLCVTCQIHFCRLRSSVLYSPSMTSAAERTFQFIGGDLCFDFCNTVGGKRGVRTREYFVSYADFLSWCRQAGLLSQADVDALLRKASHQPDAATAVLNRATELREAIYRIFAALIEDKTPQSADIARLNRELSHSL